MTIRRLFPNTTPVKDYESFRRRAINLYREWLREIPRAVQKYPLDVSVAQGRARVRQQFQLHAHFFARLPSPSTSPSTLSAMNAALLKGTQELIEVHNRWSQKTHVMRWFEGAGERESPVLLARETGIEIKRINEGLAEDGNGSINVSPFLENFLLRNK